MSTYAFWVLIFPMLVMGGFIVVLLRLHSQLKTRVEKLSFLLDSQSEDTRSFLNAYMNESRMMGFYREALMECKDEEVLDLFRRLIKDEEKHIGILEKCLSKKGG